MSSPPARRPDSEEPPKSPNPSGPAGHPEPTERPEPLKDEIAKDQRRTGNPGRPLVSPAALEVRLRRIALGLLILVPLVWWLTRTLG